jgi:hypothetical protein
MRVGASRGSRLFRPAHLGSQKLAFSSNDFSPPVLVVPSFLFSVQRLSVRERACVTEDVRGVFGGRETVVEPPWR